MARLEGPLQSLGDMQEKRKVQVQLRLRLLPSSLPPVQDEGRSSARWDWSLRAHRKNLPPVGKNHQSGDDPICSERSAMTLNLSLLRHQLLALLIVLDTGKLDLQMRISVRIVVGLSDRTSTVLESGLQFQVTLEELLRTLLLHLLRKLKVFKGDDSSLSEWE